MRCGWLLAPLALLALPAEAKAPLAWPTGIYSNVRMSAETGDLGGLEIRFYEDAGRHMAEFVYCEGWCNETHIAEVTRGDNAFMLDYVQTASGGVSSDMHFVVWRAGSTLKFSVYQGRDNIDPTGKPATLRRATIPFGLDVAKNGKE